VEMALVELYRETGERRYLTLATAFVDRRGGSAAVRSAHHRRAAA
jgi:DUF1680 family protein